MMSGLKSRKNGKHHFPYGVQKTLFGGFGRQGIIDRGADGCRSAHFVGKAGAGVKGSAVLMEGNEQRVRIMPVNVLRAVPMMTVGIDDGHPLKGIGLSKVFDHDGFDVYIAKSPGPMNDPHGMMARRSDQRESPIHRFVHNGSADGFGAAGADKMRFRHDAVDIRNAEMDPLNVLDRDQFRFEFPDAVNIQNTFFKHLVLGVQKTLFPFRVRRTDGPVKGREKNEACSVSGFQHGLLR